MKERKRHRIEHPTSNIEPRSKRGGTVRDALREGTTRLNARRLDQPRLLCEQLLSHVIGCGRLELYMRTGETLTEAQGRRVKEGIERMAAGEPLQYVLGTADFMGRSFRVNRHCLIPRPETEALVDWIAGFEPLWEKGHPVIVDVGTGSGCIAISLALDRPEGRYLAVDISENALSLARTNARAHGVHGDIRFQLNDLLAGMSAGCVDAVISNPPYVRTAEWERLPDQVRNHEPRIALDGGAQGLNVTAPLIVHAFRALKAPGFLFMEMGEDQWTDIRANLDRAGFRESQVKPDLAGKNRMVCARKCNDRVTEYNIRNTQRTACATGVAVPVLWH